MIESLIGILIVLWLLGLVAHIGGGLIWVLLVIALALYIADHYNGRGI